MSVCGVAAGHGAVVSAYSRGTAHRRTRGSSLFMEIGRVRLSTNHDRAVCPLRMPHAVVDEEVVHRLRRAGRQSPDRPPCVHAASKSCALNELLRKGLLTAEM